MYVIAKGEGKDEVFFSTFVMPHWENDLTVAKKFKSTSDIRKIKREAAKRGIIIDGLPKYIEE